MLKEFRKLLKSHRKDKNLVKFEEINCKKGTNNIATNANTVRIMISVSFFITSFSFA